MPGKVQPIPPSGELEESIPVQPARPAQVWIEGRRTTLFWILSLVLAGAFHQPLWQLFLLSGKQPHYSHIVLIPLVSAYFLWTLRHSIFGPQGGAGRWAGGVLMACGALLLAVGHQLSLPSNDGLSLTIFSLLLIWSGLFGLLFGTGTLRRAAFPLLFLLFMAPIPSLLLSWVVGLLQRGSAEIAYQAIQLSGTPVFRDGVFFSMPGLDVRVAPECSGIRSSMALVITAVVAGRMMLQSGWRRLVLVLAAIPITIFKNGLRIAALCLLTIQVDREFLVGDLHTRGGYPFFLLALAFMVPVLWMLRRSERNGSGSEARPQQSP